jgi:tetratricopeptide (TPR) repeat protein
MVLAEFHSLPINDEKRFDRIEAVYREILEKKPGHAVTLNNLAMLLAAQGKKLDEARDLIDRAKDLVGPLAALLDTRAAVLMAQGETKEALVTLREAIDEEPVAVAYFHQAQVYLLLGQREQARQALIEARRLGFRPEQLHPLERPAYDQMLKSIPTPST